jgi:hypothetical protein
LAAVADLANGIGTADRKPTLAALLIFEPPTESELRRSFSFGN